MDTSADFDLTASAVIAAKTPEAVFGVLRRTSAEAERLKSITAIYRQIVVVIHPDKQTDANKSRATQAFMLLTGLRVQAEAKVRAGTYGDTTKAAPAPPAAAATAPGPVVIKSKARAYTLTDVVTSGDLADLYRCSYSEPGETFQAIAKVGRDPADNDLLETEAVALRAIWKALGKDPRFTNYFPPLIDSLRVRADGKVRQTNIQGDLTDRYSLADVMAAYPGGIDWRDAIWMFRRTLGALGFAHRLGIIHGAVMPEHVVLRLSDHCGTLVDWAYSVIDPAKTGARVKAIVEPRQALYAREILAKKTPSPATDIYMAAMTFMALIGGNSHVLPPNIERLVVGECLRHEQSKRPQNAWELHERLGESMDRAAGKRAFRPFTMPAKP